MRFFKSLGVTSDLEQMKVFNRSPGCMVHSKDGSTSNRNFPNKGKEDAGNKKKDKGKKCGHRGIVGGGPHSNDNTRILL